MPAELACEFLAVFARMEYALKATDFGSAGDGEVKALWDRFANAINDTFGQIASEELAAAVDYLLTYPPRKQVRNVGALTFEAHVSDKQQVIAQQVLLMVRTVRNNLFHGSKFLPSGEEEPGRNQELVRHSLTVLKFCICLDAGVKKSYQQ